MAEEVMSYAKKKFDVLQTGEYTYHDIWKRKSRLITGKLDENGIWNDKFDNIIWKYNSLDVIIEDKNLK